MFRILLYICISVVPLFAHTQEVVSPSEVVAEDLNKTISDFKSIIADNIKLSLSWTVTGELPDFFVVERSENGKTFEVVAVLNNLEKKPSYQWTDDAPKKGRSFYRIKYSFGQGPNLYSSIINVAFSGYIDYKFYPNPVDHILIVRADNPIDVHISDASGKVRITETRVRGIHTINVASLEKGIYLIRFSSKLTNMVTQEKLIKN
jgi:hypothetical protein